MKDKPHFLELAIADTEYAIKQLRKGRKIPKKELIYLFLSNQESIMKKLVKLK